MGFTESPQPRLSLPATVVTIVLKAPPPPSTSRRIHRILWLLQSATYTVPPVGRTTMPRGAWNLAVSPGPSSYLTTTTTTTTRSFAENAIKVRGNSGGCAGTYPSRQGVPARVSTVPVAAQKSLTTWCRESVMYTSPCRSTATPVGQLNCASLAEPFLYPCSPVPAIVVTCAPATQLARGVKPASILCVTRMSWATTSVPAGRWQLDRQHECSGCHCQQ